LRKLNYAFFVAVLFTTAVYGQATITRDRVMANARTYRDLQWTMSSRNVLDACAKSYIKTPFTSGARVVGMAYNWGGMNTIPEFQNGIAGNGRAGNQCTTTCCVQPNTYGVDCSGLVQRAFEYGGPKLGTNLSPITTAVALGNAGMRSGDIYVLVGSHTAIHSHVDSAGNPWVIEASADEWKVAQHQRTWKYYANYQKRRYVNLQDGGLGKIDQGLTISNTPRVNRPFSAAFRLQETDGASIRYDEITVAILAATGQFKFDLQHLTNVQLASNGTFQATVGGTASLPAGSYIAVARGRIGSTWSDLLVTGTGKNSIWFAVTN
jgi:hypothetical protein